MTQRRRPIHDPVSRLMPAATASCPVLLDSVSGLEKGVSPQEPIPLWVCFLMGRAGAYEVNNVIRTIVI
jgi:hypothetical protein